MQCRLRPPRWAPSRALVFAAALPTACSSAANSQSSNSTDTAVASLDSAQGGGSADTTIAPDDSFTLERDTTGGEVPDVLVDDSGADGAADDASQSEPDLGAFDTCEGLGCQPVTGGAVCPPVAPFGVEIGETMPDLVLKTCDDGEISLHSLCEKEAVWLFGYADW